MTDDKTGLFNPASMDLREIAKAMAEREQDDLSDGSFQPKFLWFDDAGQLIMLLFPHLNSPDRDDLYRACVSLSTAHPDAKVLVWVHDSYGAKQMTKKDGSNWAPGDMQHAIEFQTEDAELVSEAFCVNVALAPTKTEPVRFGMIRIPYERTGLNIDFGFDSEDVIMEWAGEGKGRFEGTFPDMMRQAMTATKMLDMPEAPSLEGASRREREGMALGIVIGVVMGKTQWPVVIATMPDDELYDAAHKMLEKQAGVHFERVEPDQDGEQ